MFFSYLDNTTQIYWMIPISSRVQKYECIYRSKVLKYESCDNIIFGDVLGNRKVFLIQNMCPVTEEYIGNEYVESISNVPVKVDGVLQADIIKKAKIVLILVRRGQKLIFPDVLKIERELLKNK